MRRTGTNQDTFSIAVLLRHFFGCGGRGYFNFFLTFFLLFFSAFGLAQERADQVPSYNFLFSKDLPTVKTTLLPPSVNSEDLTIAIATDPQNHVYTLSFGKGVDKRDEDGNLLDADFITGLKNPLDIAIDGEGYIYIADFEASGESYEDNGQIKIYDPSGNYVRSILTSYFRPLGVDVDEDFVYIAEYNDGEQGPESTPSSRVRKVSKTTGAQVATNNNISVPYRIAVNSQQQVYVSKAGGGSAVLILSNNLSVLGQLPGIQSPGSIEVDVFDYIHVLEYSGRIDFSRFINFATLGLGEIQEIAEDIDKGIEAEAFGIKVYNPAQDLQYFFKQMIDFPVDVTFNGCDRMYVNNGDMYGGNSWLGYIPEKMEFDLEIYQRTPSADIKPPIAACVSPFTIDLAAGETKTITWEDLDDGSNDVCGGVSFNLSKEEFTEADEGENIIDLTVTDEQGQSSVCKVTVQVNVSNTPDTTDPVFTNCPSTNIVYTTDAGKCSAVANYSAPIATDDSGTVNVEWKSGPKPGEVVNTGTVSVVYTASDTAGNSVDCNFTITVEDDEAPTFSDCPEIITAAFEITEGFEVEDYSKFFPASDNCTGSITYSQDPVPGTIINTGGDHPVVLTATDGAGNVDSCEFTLQLTEMDTLSLNCNREIRVPANDQCEFILPDLSEEFNYFPEEAQISQSIASGELLTEEDTEVIITATYGGRTESCTIQIKLVDHRWPQLTCPTIYNVTVAASQEYTLPNFIDQIEATDNCGIVNIIQDPPAGTKVTEDIRVKITAEDTFGNFQDCFIYVYLQEEEKPLQVSCPQDQVLDVQGECSIALPDYTTSATYTEGADINQSPAPGTLISEDTRVTLTASLDGESVTCSFDVQLSNFSEVTLYCLQDHTVATDDDGNFMLENYMRLLNIDGACGALSYTQDPAPGTVVNSDTEITLTVTDENGNSDDCSFTLKLEDSDPGIFGCNDVGLFLDSNGSASLTGRDVYAGDPDDPAIESLKVSKEEFNCSDVGTTQTVALTVFYRNGTSQSCNSKVTVHDDLSPEIYCIAPGKKFPLVDGSVTIDVNDLIAQTGDNCEDPKVWLSQDTFTSTGTKTITIYAEDASGLTDSCTTTIEITAASTTPGTCKPAIVYLDESGKATLEPEEVFNGNPNDASITDMVVDRNTFTCEDLEEPVEVNLTVNYSDGSSTTCTASVTVKDDIDPVASCVSEFTLYINDEGYGLLSADIINDGSRDNCGSVTTTLSQTRFTNSDVGVQTVILTVTDASGNTSTCETEVTIVSNDEAGGVNCPEDLEIVLDENGEYELELTYSGDDENIEIEISKSHFTCEDLGRSQVITATYLGEYTGSCVIPVTVIDDLPPAVQCVEEFDLRLNASGTARLSVEDLHLDSSDNCGISEYRLSQYDFTTADVGEREVILTAVDGSGNSNTCIVTVNVLPFEDTNSVECVDLHVIQIGENGRAILNPRDLFTGGTGTAQFEVTKDTFTCLDLGENTVTLNYSTPTDEGLCEVTVIVEDPLSHCGEPVDPTNGDYIILYPNPSDGIVHFQTSPGLEIHRLEVFDMRGRYLFEKIYDSNSIFDKKLNLQEYQSGVYSILIFTNGKEYLKRAIIRN